MHFHIYTLFAAAVVIGVSCQMPEQCCMSHRFSANVVDLKAIYHGLETKMRVSFDLSRLLQTMQIFQKRQSSQDFVKTGTYAIRYMESAMYYFTADEAGGCQRIPFSMSDMPDMGCVSGMNYKGSFTMGRPTAQLQVNMWEVVSPKVNVTFWMSSPGCGLVMQAITGQLFGRQTDAVYMYESYEIDHIDSGALDIPIYCDWAVHDPTL